MVRWCAAVEIWRRDHYDLDYAVNRAGLPNIVGSGAWTHACLHHLLSQWAGPDGWVFRVSQRVRATMLPGDCLTAWGRVTATRVVDGLGYVELETGMRKADGGGRRDRHRHGRAAAAGRPRRPVPVQDLTLEGSSPRERPPAGWHQGPRLHALRGRAGLHADAGRVGGGGDQGRAARRRRRGAAAGAVPGRPAGPGGERPVPLPEHRQEEPDARPQERDRPADRARPGRPGRPGGRELPAGRDGVARARLRDAGARSTRGWS